MGSEDLHHRRKARSARDLARKESSKDAYETVLIVCEGKKTEPNYFQELVDDLRLNSANIKVTKSDHSCPLHLVESALDSSKSGEYDRIFCVFDKDKHTRYSQAIDLISKSGGVLVAANSVPCFEYWIILHFEYSTAAFYGSPRKSPGDEAVAKLRKHIKDYQKGKQGLYALIKASTSFALKNSSKARVAARNANTDNPTTSVDEVVNFLFEIRKKIDAG